MPGVWLCTLWPLKALSVERGVWNVPPFQDQSQALRKAGQSSGGPMGPGGSQPGANASSATDPWRASCEVPELRLSFLGYEMGALLDSVATDVTGLGRDHTLTFPVLEHSRPAKLSGGGRG